MTASAGRPAGSKDIRVWRDGKYVTPRTLPTWERFLCYVEKTETCWLWIGTVSRKGYGSFSVKGSKFLAHRFAYEQQRGAIPAGLEIDHLCRVRNCVNPQHLEPVSHKVNVLRSPENPIAVAANATTCPAGHELEPWKDSRRRCFTCSPRKPSLDERLADSFTTVGDCWIWTAETTGGYPRFFDGTRRVQAARFMYDRHRGEIPPGWSFVNKCGDRACVNPWHGDVTLDARWHPKVA